MVIILIISIFNGGMPGAVFNYGIYPRSMGMGKAFAGVGGDVEAGYYNPAGLVALRSNDLRAAHQTLYGGARLEYLGYSFPTRRYGSFAFTVINHALEGFYSFDENLQRYSSFSFSENCLIFSYSLPIGPIFGVGANLKGISSKLAQYSDVGIGGDFGFFLFPHQPYSVGFAVQNVVPPSLKFNEETDVFPITFRLGGSSKLYQDRILLALDLAQPLEYELNPHLGLEFVAIPRTLILRAGVDGNELSFGGGFKRTLGHLSFGIDYAMLLHHSFNYQLGNTHKFGLYLEFGGYRVWIESKPKTFSPSPTQKDNVVWLDLHVHAKHPVKRWQLLVKNSLGEVVRTFSSWGDPPKRLTWDGLDDVGRVVADGDYYYEIVVIDEKNDVLKYDDFLTAIRTIGPAGELEVIPQK
ncbi:MAG TPA: hypothetical protein EYP58_05800 [bacterium (Candidatus Stahlbacteria)]|nr:hypothetical protein [Candidatus Stahlbacteria bacterium]